MDNVYCNCNFIFGSAAEVERLWNHAKYILTNERKGMMEPITFEALLFLENNHHYWRDVDVAEVCIPKIAATT